MVTVSKCTQGRDVILLTVIQFAVVAALAWIFGLCFETFPTQFRPETIGGMLYLIIACTAVAMLCQNIGQKHVHPATASILMSLESVFGVAFSMAFYHERLTFRLIAGFLLIFLAVLTSETKLSFLKPGLKKHSGENR